MAKRKNNVINLREFLEFKKKRDQEKLIKKVVAETSEKFSLSPEFCERVARLILEMPEESETISKE